MKTYYMTTTTYQITATQDGVKTVLETVEGLEDAQIMQALYRGEMGIKTIIGIELVDSVKIQM